MRQPATQSNPAPARAPSAATARSRVPAWLLAVLLALVTLALYWPATRHDFVNYDDIQYVLENPHVTSGMTWENVRWAFGSSHAANWHPVTWLSHMLDCQLFGLNPWGHHLTNVALHALNAMLVFGLLQQMTGARWRSWLVAALFAVHPLHVESVAWVAERKDVLSGCFGLLALIFYARYGRQRWAAERGALQAPAVPALASRPATLDYVLALVFLALGLMSKPMLVTWPFVLLLLDYWPLGRFAIDDLRITNSRSFPSRVTRHASLLWEKIPFFVLAAAASAVTYLVQKHAGALEAGEDVPLEARSGNALISYCRYLGKLFWPTDLAVFYPYAGPWPAEQVVLAGGLLVGITGLLMAQRRRYPYLLMGWLWYCGTLVPVIGLVQVGAQAMADRYTYLPSLGLLILVVWGVGELTRGWRYQGLGWSLAGGVAIILCLALTRQQIGYWKNSETLFRHALEVTQNNYLAHKMVGDALNEKGETDAAIRQFQEAIRLNPNYAKAYNNLGSVLLKQGQIDEAIHQFRQAMRLKPDDAVVHANLGIALDEKGQTDAAIGQFREALRLKPHYAVAHNNLGNDLLKQGQIDEAISQFQEAMRLKPDDAVVHYNLGNALVKEGQIDAAIRLYQEALRLKPDYANAHNNLGNAFLNRGQIADAIRHFQEALRLKLDLAGTHYSLGNALFQQGQLDEAIRQYEAALRLKPDHAETHNRLGVALAMKGQTDEAMREFQEALRLKPDFAEAHNNLGNALLAKGQLDAAIGQYREALRLRPDYASARDNLAKVLELQSKSNVGAPDAVKP